MKANYSIVDNYVIAVDNYAVDMLFSFMLFPIVRVPLMSFIQEYFTTNESKLHCC